MGANEQARNGRSVRAFPTGTLQDDRISGSFGEAKGRAED